MKSFKRTATISKRSPGILLRVPRRCTNGSEEVFHRGFIAIEQLAVEVTWVPIDYHPPQIEDCGTIFCHCKYILSFLREPSIMSVSGAKRNSFRYRSPVPGRRFSVRRLPVPSCHSPRVAVSACIQDSARSSEPMRAQARTESDQVLPQPSGTIARRCDASHAERDS